MRSTKSARARVIFGGGTKGVQQQGRSCRHLARRTLFLETLEPRNLLATGAALPPEELVGTHSGVQADLPSVLLPAAAAPSEKRTARRLSRRRPHRNGAKSSSSMPRRPMRAACWHSCPPRPSPIGSWRSHFSTRHRMGLRSSKGSLPQSRAGTRFT